jgi:hypothetical protein
LHPPATAGRISMDLEKIVLCFPFALGIGLVFVM